jgi:hypothetical protein
VVKDCTIIGPQTCAIRVPITARLAVKSTGTAQNALITITGTRRTTTSVYQLVSQLIPLTVVKDCTIIGPQMFAMSVPMDVKLVTKTTGTAQVAMKDSIITGSSLVPTWTATTTKLSLALRTKQITTEQRTAHPQQPAMKVNTSMNQCKVAILAIQVVLLVIRPTGTAPHAKKTGILTLPITITTNRHVFPVTGIIATGIGIHGKYAMT